MDSMTETQTIERVGIDVDTTTGDHDRFAHYVKAEDVLRAAVDGVAVPALCGKKWVPTRDPEKYPICKICVEVLARIRGRI